MKGRRPERAGESRDSAPRYGARTAEARDTHAFSGRQLADYPVLVEFLLCVELAAIRTAHRRGRIDSLQLDALTKGCNEALKSSSEDFICEVLQALGESAWVTNIREVVGASTAVEGHLDSDTAFRCLAEGPELALGSIAGRLALNTVGQRAIAALDETVDLLRVCAAGFQGSITPATWEEHAERLSSDLRALDRDLKHLHLTLPSHARAGDWCKEETVLVFSEQLRELCITPIAVEGDALVHSEDLEAVSERAHAVAGRLLAIQTDTQRAERMDGLPAEPDSLAPCCVQVRGAVDAARRWLTAEHQLGSEAGALINLYEAFEMLREGVFKFNTQILAPATMWCDDDDSH